MGLLAESRIPKVIDPAGFDAPHHVPRRRTGAETLAPSTDCRDTVPVRHRAGASATRVVCGQTLAVNECETDGTY